MPGQLQDRLVPASLLASTVVGAFVAGATSYGFSAVDLPATAAAAPVVTVLGSQPSIVVTPPYEVSEPVAGTAGSSVAGASVATAPGHAAALGRAVIPPLPLRRPERSVARRAAAAHVVVPAERPAVVTTPPVSTWPAPTASPVATSRKAPKTKTSKTMKAKQTKQPKHARTAHRWKHGTTR